MRVIAGTFRSRVLRAPPGLGTRPTSDRLRETIFNILAARIAGARFLDLYAGTGAVGIEALSRGAASVLFAEAARPAAAAIRLNLQALGVAAGWTLEERKVEAVLDRLLLRVGSRAGSGAGNSEGDSAGGGARFDLVYLDPPYADSLAYSSTLGLLGSSRGQLLLAPGALVVAEHGSKVSLPQSFGVLRQTRTLKQGDAALSFYAVTARAATDAL